MPLLTTFASTLRAHLRVLALDICAPSLTAPAFHLTLIALHLTGLFFVARLAHWPLWAALVLLALFCLPQLVIKRFWSESLAPLAVLYGLVLLRLVWVHALRQPVPVALDYGWGLALSGAWSGLVLLRCGGRLAAAWVIAGAAAAGLFAWQLWRLAPAGVTGADPLAYVLMALDLARHDTPLHHFELAPLASGLGLPTLPVTHVGYVLPDPGGWAPTVWPAGFSVFLAAAFRLGGERAMLTYNVWVALASFAATAGLTALLAPRGPRLAALAAGLAAVAVLATSPEQWVRLAVPLADGAAQLFTTLAVVMALITVKIEQVAGVPLAYSESERNNETVCRPSSVVRRPLWGKPAGLKALALLGAATGLTLAAAFSVRYTQALVAPGLLLVALWALKGKRQRLAFGLALVAAWAVAAAPDLYFRTRLFGAPWRFGTGELALFEAVAVPGAARQLAAELLRPGEFGWLWVLVLAGVAHGWRHHRSGLFVVAVAYAPVLLFHLWYPFVRARDVLFVLAPLAAYGALGGAALLAFLWRRGPAVCAVTVAGLLLLGAARIAPLLDKSPGFFTYGGLLPEQRAALELLATLTEPDAVIACSLNSGAVELYGQRLTVRPGGLLQPEAAWSSEQWLTFVDALHAQGRPLYVLTDSPELELPLADLQARYALEHVADLYLPVFEHGGGSENGAVGLWRVK